MARASRPCWRPGIRTILVPTILFILTTVSRAQQVELTSPLDGHARPGRAAAVRIAAGGLAGSSLTLTAPGVLAVRLPVVGGRVDAVVPVLWQSDPPAELTWSDGKTGGTASLPARPLGIDDRLIAVAGDVPDAAQLAAELFPGKRPTVVRVETDRPKPLHPAAAYESADAVLLDLPAAARVGEGQLRTFLAAGTAVAVRSRAMPVPGWPWARRGAWWVLRHEVAGPAAGTVAPDVYAPTYAWDRARPASVRRTALLAAVAAAIGVLGATLWRSRWGAAAAVAACATAAVGAAAYGASLAPVVLAAGEVIVWDGKLAQQDRWTYVSALRAATVSVPAADGVTKPAPSSRRLAEGLAFELRCGADGAPAAFEVALPAKVTVAFLSRTVSAGSPPAVGPTAVGPIVLFADKLYPGALQGQAAGPANPAGEWWGTVVMRR